MVLRCPPATKPTSSSSSGVSGRCPQHPLVPQTVAATRSRLQQGATAHAASVLCARCSAAACRRGHPGPHSHEPAPRAGQVISAR